jgi:hypothetical protein
MIIYMHRYCRADLRANPNVLFAFGDNERRIGYGGQAAEARGESNAVGIPTLYAPGMFWDDEDSQRQCDMIDDGMARLFIALRSGCTIVWPIDGVGSGLADLERRSPTTWAHLQRRIAELKTLGNTK